MGHAIEASNEQVEMAILKGFASGLTERVIGQQFGVTAAAITKRAKGMRQRWGAVDRAHLVAIAYDRGVLKPRGVS
jgi:DNA-binding NarL/FixJ family response regulator